MRSGATLYCRVNRKYVLAKRPTATKPTPQEGVFYIRYELHGKRYWENAGTIYRSAIQQLHLRAAQLADKQSITAPVAAPAIKMKNLLEWRNKFLRDKRTIAKKDGTMREADTIIHYEQVTDEFISSSRCSLPSDVNREVLLDWLARQRERVSHRTICNLYASVASFLLYCGVDHKTMLTLNERPTPDDGIPEAYTQEQMTTFFAHVKRERDHIAFEFLLKTGAREREMTELLWSDLNLGPNPYVKFPKARTKTRKDRVVPLEQKLAARLRDWRSKNPTTRYVFGTNNDHPDTHFLETCKDIAGKCGYERDKFFLHKFRSTFATWSLQRNVDIRTVQAWLGHTDINMTQRYLSPAGSDLAQSGINRAFGAETLGATA